jgi:hypothetical protein
MMDGKRFISPEDQAMTVEEIRMTLLSLPVISFADPSAVSACNQEYRRRVEEIADCEMPNEENEKPAIPEHPPGRTPAFSPW